MTRARYLLGVITVVLAPACRRSTPPAVDRPPSAPTALSSSAAARPAPVAAVAPASEPAVAPASAPTAAPASAPAGFVLVPPGTFTMGSPRDEPGRGSNEDQHAVTITRAFLLSRTEVTHREWRALVGAPAASFKGCEDCPVEEISWWEALDYCNRLSRRDGLEACYALRGCRGKAGRGLTCASVRAVGIGCKGFRLPTESEWELAARAATLAPAQRRRPSALPREPRAWCATPGGARPVGTREPNALGLLDMLGNVSEWVWDWSGRYEVEGADPEGADYDPGEAFRIHRGGSWSGERDDCRLAARGAAGPATREEAIGLRPARTVGPEATLPEAAARAAAATVAEIEAEVRRIDRTLRGVRGRALVFPARNTMGASLTVYEREGVILKIVSTDFGETGRWSQAYYYRERAPILVVAGDTRYAVPVNAYGDRRAGKPAAAVGRSYFLAGTKLVQLRKNGEEVRFPEPRLGMERAKEAAAALATAVRCPGQRPPCKGCACESKDCRDLTCD